MKNWGKSLTCALLALCLLASCVPALADGFAYWENGSAVYFNQAANRGYSWNGYQEPYESPYYKDSALVRVISKSASIWQSARTNSKRLGTVKNGDNVTVFRDGNGDPYMQNGFYSVNYNGQYGWINSDYCVYAPVEIVLMESNVPAYCAPDSSSKKVGSLSKLTRYTVLGTYGDYYIVNLRQASAFIPMSVDHYDTFYECRFLPAWSNEKNGVIIAKTKLRTGPGESYSSVEEVKAGYQFVCLGEINGWYILSYNSSSTDGEVLVYVPVNAADVSWG